MPRIEGFRSGTVTLGGVRLRYWIGGSPDGQPVILWHGFLGSSYSWRHVAPALAAAGLAVLVPDMRGYGESDKPEGVAGYDARALAAECRTLAAAIGFGRGRKVVLCAHDMGTPAALLWAADHPDEIAGLLYIEGPVMLGRVLEEIIAYTPEAAKDGSMWWWLLPLAPGAPEALIVGNERAFLEWFYYGAMTAKHEVFDAAVVDEHVRTFAGREGVLGATGVYRAAFTSIAQTEPLTHRKVEVPVAALGGEASLGPKVGEMVSLVAARVEAQTVPGCGHFIPEECPDEVVRSVLAMVGFGGQALSAPAP